MGRDGFEPSKTESADLQSAPIGRSGTYPNNKNGAGDRNRTNNLLITNQLLCQLSYTSIFIIYYIITYFSLIGASGRNRTTDTGIFSPLLYRLSYRGKFRNPLRTEPKLMATRSGLEPLTSCVTGRRSNQLN